MTFSRLASKISSNMNIQSSNVIYLSTKHTAQVKSVAILMLVKKKKESDDIARIIIKRHNIF